ncbi:NTP transferase domain-containing protein [Thermosipho ferrireducens]|uniref:NTP transferase domain-containing protein n=1 Tax=Thermosipho ferrireducens TaxID=2571116 RepID=A0ABX7S5F7_9BACT|nr:NTP transferase domain-containing protein [Thermosipho ferrireducens]QTA37379.1 NTP transferase domain-containing protein [Thermosipho ferrireducens]
MKIYSIILAAGKGSRFSKGVKILYKIEKYPMLQHVVNLVHNLRFEKNFLIVNPMWKKIASKFLLPQNFTVIENKDYVSGISSSIKIAISHINEIEVPDYVTIFLGDMPFIKESSVKKILEHADGKRKIIAPFYKEKKGFPTLIHKTVFSEIFSLQGDKGVKQIIERHPEYLFKVEFKTTDVIKDVDK